MKKIQKYTACLLMSLTLVGLTSTSAFSQEKSVENAFAECGIGAAIFKNNETGAIISNIIWDLGTTALSSQISSPDSCEGASETAARFIDKSYHALEEEVVKGEGVYLTALLDIVGCPASAKASAAQNMQASFHGALKSGELSAASSNDKSVMMGRMLDQTAMTVCSA